MKPDADQSPQRLEEFLAAVTPAKRQRDARTLINLFSDITGMEPRLWGTIIGFGSYEYSTSRGPAGDLPMAAFAPRRQASTIYLGPDVLHDEAALKGLGPHTTSKGCLYIKDLTQIDLGRLRDLVERDFRSVAD